MSRCIYLSNTATEDVRQVGSHVGSQFISPNPKPRQSNYRSQLHHFSSPTTTSGIPLCPGRRYQTVRCARDTSSTFNPTAPKTPSMLMFHAFVQSTTTNPFLSLHHLDIVP
ncbi:hypothetical protein VTJ04DRAFT_8534 [Mycothermus thermophilus]|uniref:uncharacterized protein n=1 Tax=Humicola insolens TaxID=85995 RepID=UPI003742158A